MSRIGKKPVALPQGVTLEVKGMTVTVTGPKGTLTYTHLPSVSVAMDGSEAKIDRKDDTAGARAAHGLTRALVANMVVGVSKGYEKKLEVIGVGYKVNLKGKNVELLLGFSHPILFPLPEGITVTQDEKNKNLITISGIDKQLVGQTAARIRELRPPEPYKGKGIKYTDETIRRKVGKAAVSKSA